MQVMIMHPALPEDYSWEFARLENDENGDMKCVVQSRFSKSIEEAANAQVAEIARITGCSADSLPIVNVVNENPLWSRLKEMGGQLLKGAVDSELNGPSKYL